ncbi:hypothetical protein COO91_08477 [Nostoc flagelliforme CCNUN1]|uniref:Uncharacterized protein n=1 Tax=Nostoc flagelliforme CCNUN1 TaxID=2038116 RepID=A0A2K8T3T0_9NOSO|nr:hypothetical protein COO91_08477 [Nostoc flagelliforme CCNUN1]
MGSVPTDSAGGKRVHERLVFDFELIILNFEFPEGVDFLAFVGYGEE